MRTALPPCQFSSGSSLSTTGTLWGCPADALEKVQQMTAHGSNLALSVSANKVFFFFLSEYGLHHSLRSICGGAEWFRQSRTACKCLAFYKTRLHSVARVDDPRAPFLLCELAGSWQAASCLLVKNCLLRLSVRCGAESVGRSAGLLSLPHSTLT